jgi:hypothetical protein
MQIPLLWLQIRIQGIMTKNAKLYSWKKIYFLDKKTDILLIPRPPRRTSKLQEKPSALKGEHPALRNMKFLHFFLFSWANFAHLDPDPDPADHKQCKSRSGSPKAGRFGSRPVQKSFSSSFKKGYRKFQLLGLHFVGSFYPLG